MPENITPQRRFKVALSFPGEKREYIKEVADILVIALGEGTVFYDNYFRHELARPNLDIYLINIYKEQADLVAYFLCEDYTRKEWCGLEWRAIRDIIKHKGDDELMPFRFDSFPVDGELSIDGHIPAHQFTPREVADFIIKRVRGNTTGMSEVAMDVSQSMDLLKKVESELAQLLEIQKTNPVPALLQQILDLSAEKETLRQQLLQSKEIIAQQEPIRQELEKLLSNEKGKNELKQEALRAVEERDYDKAENLLKEAANERIQEVADDFYQLGNINELKLDYREALRYYELAVNIQPANDDFLYKAGELSKNLGFYDKALEYLERSLSLVLEQYGEGHYEVGTLYNNIGLIHSRKGNYDMALEYYFRAMDINERTVGNEHTDTGITYNNIGEIYRNKREYDKALEYYAKDLVISEKVLGKEHPDTATTYNNIGLAYNGKGRYDEALEYHHRALLIFEKTLGIEHPSTATTYNNIGTIYRNKNEYDEALRYHGKALAVHEKILGKEHPNTATSYNNIASTWYSKGNNERAIEYCEHAYKIDIKALGPDHPNTIMYKENLDFYKSIQ